MTSGPRYDPNPCYPPVLSPVRVGWAEIVAALTAPPALVVAIDGPASMPWETVAEQAADACEMAGAPVVSHFDTRSRLLPYDRIISMTSSAQLKDDPDFELIPQAGLPDLFEDVCLAPAPPLDGVCLLYGPGAALFAHDTLWYADLPKRYAEEGLRSGRYRNLGQRETDGTATARRLLYVDWPLLDRHRENIARRIDQWIDLQDAAAPRALDGAAMRETLSRLAAAPFRTRPTFNSAPWGGTWGQTELGMNIHRPNSALGYELIAPESGILLGDCPDRAVEVPFHLLVGLHPEAVLGQRVHQMFGTSFPVRFDYLDTLAGGNLSVHCHPVPDYMREVFGWPYTQHESYYLMRTSADSEVFLGLRAGADVGQFHARAQAAHAEAQPFDPRDFVNALPARDHQLYLIPAGTPHGSGRGNVVLEVSATPYLYSLRFYDWLRRDGDGLLRPVHVEHAFRNLDVSGDARDLVQEPVTVRRGDGWAEEILGSLEAMFFEVRRLVLDDAGVTAGMSTGGGFALVNVVEGTGAVIRARDGGAHQLAYAETLVIPASVGGYSVTAIGPGRTRLVLSSVRRP